MKHVTGRSAFTLIELLVVIVIVGLLIGLLVPALGQARSLAREKGCSSNMQQIQVAVVNYATQDSRGACPFEQQEHNPHPDLLEALKPFIDGTDIYYCLECDRQEAVARNPSYTPTGGVDSVINTEANVLAGNISYIYWSFRENKADPAPWRNPEFYPRKLYLDRSEQVPGGPVPHSVNPSKRWLTSDFFRQGAPFPHARLHKSGLNVGYQDGHVALMIGQPKKIYR